MAEAGYWAGAAGAVLFVLVFLVDGGTRPGYSPIRHPVSALALGRRGWIQSANFVVTGTAVTAGAVAMATWGQAVLLGAALAVFGLGLVASGIFRMDPMRGYPPGTPDQDPAVFSARHRMHDLAGAVVFLALPAAAAVAAFVLPGLAWRLGSGLLAVGLLIGFGLFGTAWEEDSPRTGLLQRVLIVPGWLWLAGVFVQYARP